MPKVQLGHGLLRPRLNQTTKCPSLCSTPQYGGSPVCLNLRNVHSESTEHICTANFQRSQCGVRLLHQTRIPLAFYTIATGALC